MQWELNFLQTMINDLKITNQWGKWHNIKFQVKFSKLDITIDYQDGSVFSEGDDLTQKPGWRHSYADLIWVCKYRLLAEKPFCRLCQNCKCELRMSHSHSLPRVQGWAVSICQRILPLVKVAAAVSLVYVDVKLPSKIKDWHLGLMLLW